MQVMKSKISPSFTASEVYNFTNEIEATKLAANDIQLTGLFLDPNDTKKVLLEILSLNLMLLKLTRLYLLGWKC